MKIAIVSTPWVRVPPERYGGIEYLVSLLADGLVERGHNVTLFTVGSSVTRAKKRWVFERARLKTLAEPPPVFLNEALTHSLNSYLEIAREGDFDLVSDHTWKEGLASACFLPFQTVHTIHGPMNEENKRFYGMFKNQKRIHFITISDYQKKCFPGLNYAGTVHNAIALEEYPFSEDKEDYLLYLGRFNPQKAPHLACEAAEKLGKRLVLAGKIREDPERAYFDKYVKPHLRKKITYVGEVSDKGKKDLFKRASAFLMPIQWDEPFGITMIEAMACGTPVVAFRRGAAPEIVLSGITGYLADDFKGFVEKIKMVDKINPKDCRKQAELNFSSKSFVDGYERIFKKIAGSVS